MSDTSAEGSLKLFRRLTIFLALVVVGLGYMVVDSRSSEDETAEESAKQEIPDSPSPPPAAEIPAQPSTSTSSSPGLRVRAIGLRDNFEPLPVLFSDITRYGEWLSQGPPGALRFEVLGFGQEDAWQFRRRRSIASVILAGQATVEWMCGSQPGSVTLETGDAIWIDPYCTHRWRNPAMQEMLARVDFVMPWPREMSASDAVIVAPDDPRGLFGTAPSVVSANALSGLEGPVFGPDTRIRVENISDRTEMAAVDGVSAAYVLAGSGALADGQALGTGTVVIVPSGRPWTALPASEMTLLRFVPADDGVPLLVRTGASEYSQGREELIARAFFGDRRNGVFLDVGASDYQELSTTYYLDSVLGWTGVAIDGQAEYAEGYAEHRPNTRFLTYLVTDTPGDPGVLYRDNRVPVVAAMNSEVAGEQSRVAVGEEALEAIEVPTVTLNQVLEAEGIESIDFLSMDIGEHEPAALRGFDIDRYQPELVCVEAHGRTQDVLYAWFSQHGYERLDAYLTWDPVNWYFAPRADQPASAP